MKSATITIQVPWRLGYKLIGQQTNIISNRHKILNEGLTMRKHDTPKDWVTYVQSY
jgi:hypothetical protein